MGGFSGIAVLITALLSSRRDKAARTTLDTINDNQKTNHGSDGRIGGAVDHLTDVLTAVQTGMEDIKTEVGDIKTDLHDVKTDISGLREDDRIARRDTAELGKRVAAVESKRGEKA